MTAAEPLVSVVTPVHNGARYLAECIESVLAQRYRNLEYVIVDNASTDETAQIAEHYAAQDARIRIVHTPSLLPIMTNWNYMLSQIADASRYCKVVHADDWLFPDCVPAMVALAENHPNVALVGSYALWRKRVACTGLPHDQCVFSGRDVCRMTLQRRIYPFLSPSCLLIRADRIRRNPSFYQEGSIQADVDMCYRELADADFGFLHQVLTFVRWHEESVTRTVDKPWNRALVWNLDLLLRHGPVYLSEPELHAQLNRQIGSYYRYLADARRDGMPAEFWAYHKGELARLGLPYSPANLLRARLVNLLHRLTTRMSRRSSWVRSVVG